MHKKTGQLLLATPWWEIPDGLDVTSVAGCSKAVWGALTQVGWLLQNENEVWLGVGLNAAPTFFDIGVL